MLIAQSPIATPMLQAFLSQLKLAPSQAHEHLTLWPLTRSDGAPQSLRYVTLSQAVARGELLVDELRTGAQVPHVLVVNRGALAVLALFGEEIRGAKQNRIANASFLIPPKGQVVIDVSCVEAGRWQSAARPTGAGFASPRFETTGSVVSHAMRRAMSHTVAESRASGGGFRANQGEVWDSVAACLSESATDSASSAWSDYAKARSDRLARSRAHFAPSGVGFVAAIDGEVVGMDAIGDAAVYAHSFSRLVDAYLIDALDESADKVAPKPADPEAFLAKVREAPATEGPSLGLGADVRLRSEAVEGAALVAGEVVHLTAAPAMAKRSPRARRGAYETDDFVSPFEAEFTDIHISRRRRGVA